MSADRKYRWVKGANADNDFITIVEVIELVSNDYLIHIKTGDNREFLVKPDDLDPVYSA